MSVRKLITAGSVIVALLAALPAHAQRNIIHEERSQYRDVLVTEFNNQRCMLFNIRRGDMNQTCIDLRDPKRLVFSYTRMSFVGLLFNPEPERILVAGLGGGTIPSVLHELYPRAEIDVLEVDPAVVRVAERFFNFQQDERMTVHTVDARVFIKRAGLRNQTYDYIVLDAFSGEYVPEHLLTREFLQEVADILTDDGVLIANTFASSGLYDHESVTYQAVFGRFYALREAGSGNRILVAGKREWQPAAELVSPARRLQPSLQPYGFNILEYPARLTDAVDWDTSARVLTDQYSPANLLRN